ncbi:nitroreductase/quinone reductase family protein [Georgenia halophila]|uniref:Nitroreductase/quinone reductase family protein n=1 Tax=Georgenia halophila TaxID=620889 RepID=A0ABP8KTE7_9MICO
MPSDFAFKAMNGVHRGILKISGGRAGWRVYGMPVLRLTTIGRKSGRPRSVVLASPIQEDGSLVVVASRGGDDIHPAWFLNLCADPEVEVSYQGQPARPMRARVATADERRRLWSRIVADHENYARYQGKTEREIPLVLLDEPSI